MFTSKKLLIFIGRNAAISLVIIFISIFAIFFIKKQIVHITDVIVLNNKLTTELKKRTELLSVIKHDAQIVGSNDTLISNAFISSDNISGFINVLDVLASNNKISESYRFETPTEFATSEPLPLSSISYTNSMGTSVTNFSNYLKGYEKLPYFTQITGLNITSQDKLGWTGLSTISIDATLITSTTQ